MFSLPTSGPWVYVVIALINSVISTFALVISVIAFMHCVLQRSDAFTAIGTLTKGLWALLLGGASVVTFFGVLAAGSKMIGIFSLLAIVAAAIYILDVRPGLRDASNGRW
ncbi:MAG: DUF2516 family protein [Longispora sp.]|nr:DUF2516 family protein [Longispora sp. (in: high G+C Gram-positive bacteria)]